MPGRHGAASTERVRRKAMEPGGSGQSRQAVKLGGRCSAARNGQGNEGAASRNLCSIRPGLKGGQGDRRSDWSGQSDSSAVNRLSLGESGSASAATNSSARSCPSRSNSRWVSPAFTLRGSMLKLNADRPALRKNISEKTATSRRTIVFTLYGLSKTQLKAILLYGDRRRFLF